MIRVTALGLALLACACAKTIPPGASCTEPKECGKGADCYRGVCTPMCVKDSECAGELVCARHHCLLATGEPLRTPAVLQTPTDKPSVPLYGPLDTRPAAHAENAPTDGRPSPPPVEPPPYDPTVEPRPRPGTRGQPILGPLPMAAESTRALQGQIEALRAEQKRLEERIQALENKRP